MIFKRRKTMKKIFTDRKEPRGNDRTFTHFNILGVKFRLAIKERAYRKKTEKVMAKRKYLTKNANSILDHNFKEACNDVGYFKRPIDITSIHSNKFKQTNEPHLYSSLDDETKPFGYTSSDLKSIYLTREELQSRKISPTITQDNLLKAQLRL